MRRHTGPGNNATTFVRLDALLRPDDVATPVRGSPAHPRATGVRLALVLLVAQVVPAPASAMRLFVANSGDDTVSVVDTDLDREVQTIPVGKSPAAIVLRADPPLVAVANSQASNVIEGIRYSSRSLLPLVDDVLDLRKLEAGKMPIAFQRVALGRFMDDFRARERMPLSPRVSLTWDIAPGLPAIETDPAKLTVILDNLVNNAIKFTSTGTITVGVRSAGDTSRVVFRVEDTGTGIAPEQHAAIFEPFHRIEGDGDRNYGGAGLGLAIVHRYVTLLGGHVTVRSQPGVGTTFEVTLAGRPGRTDEGPGTSASGQADRRAA